MNAVLQERYDRLAAALGSTQALQGWMAENGYTEESFREDLSRAIAAAWMRDQVIARRPGGDRAGACPPDPAPYGGGSRPGAG